LEKSVSISRKPKKKRKKRESRTAADQGPRYFNSMSGHPLVIHSLDALASTHYLTT
jgi:hypothetical protein